MLDGRTYTVYYESLKNGLKAHINGHRCVFPDDYDPSCLTTPYPGKLLRFLVEEGQRVAVGQAYAELEVMKTVLPLLSSTTGLVQNLLPKGTHLRKGDVLCRVRITLASLCHALLHIQRWKKLRIGISVGDNLTRPFHDARRFPSPGLQPVPRATRTPRTFGICPSFRAIFCRPVPNATIRTIRNFVIVVSCMATDRRNSSIPSVCAHSDGSPLAR
jgi:hypothetical protein